MATLVFISYSRRDVSLSMAARVFDVLASKLGRDVVFFDNSTIPTGHSWPVAIQAAIEKCEVFIPLIGKQWLSIVTGDADSWIHKEVRRALDRKCVIFPILLDGASMPNRATLPPDIAAVSDEQGIHIDSRSDAIFRVSVEEVARQIRQRLGEVSLRRRNELHCEIRLVRSLPPTPSDVIRRDWILSVDGEELLSLSGIETSKEALCPIGPHTLKLTFDEATHNFQGPMGSGGPSYAKGTTEPLNIVLVAGRYQFGLNSRNQAWWRSVLDGMARHDTATHYIEQKSYEPWE